jgi:hypothetical protein
MGPEGIFATLIKGVVHKAVDDWLNNDLTNRQSFLNDLKALQPSDANHTDEYLEILRGVGVITFQLEYLRRYWFSPDGFWTQHRYPFHPTEPIVRMGLIKAIEVANEAPALPIDSYWVAAGDKFETIVMRSPWQVTRLLLTPPSPPPGNASMVSNYADIRVVKRTANIGLWEFMEPPAQSSQVIITRLKTVPDSGVQQTAE